jgi:dolichol-phosphate mannosyltransferase
MTSSVAFAIPAYNEADGIGDFLREIDAAFEDWAGDVTFVVVDDCSTDATLDVVKGLASQMRSDVRALTMPANSKHGPTVLRAYTEAVALRPDLVIQVDGDGQFSGRDVRRLADDLRSSGADVALACRRERRDPWFRKVLTRSLRLYLRRRANVRALDPNAPLRGYRSTALSMLLPEIPVGAAVPNVYLTVLSESNQLATVELVVEHLERRGGPQGTMWGQQRRKLGIPKRLLLFVVDAGRECRSFLRDVDRRRVATRAGAPDGDAAPGS